ncbi:MAG: hybrid sensor histidine kinase/response regulator, partial [Cytophagales bacterium]
MEQSEHTYEKKIILYVDDEPKNLSSFKSVFRRFYKILVAESAQEGLALMRDNPIHLVISDQRMPKMTGVEFLEFISKEYPDVTRVIITGYSDMEAIVEAINRGKVFSYVTKPWKTDELKITIDHALEAYQLKKQNQQLILDLKKVNDELDKFVYSAAHDLRAPITTILGLIHLARMENNLDTIKELLELKEKMAKKLDDYIQDIVNYSFNIHTEVQKERIYFAPLIEKILEDYKYYESCEAIEKYLHIEQEEAFYSDKARLMVILQNVIENAIRYANVEQEKPFLKVEVKVNTESVSIKITDNGIGIKEEYLSHIFDMFFRASDKKHGSGLGLFVVKETIEKLDGDILVESQHGKGTIVNITIPNLENQQE